MLRLIIQTSTHDEYDQDSSTSFDDDEDSTASQEEEVEDWIENEKKMRKDADKHHHKLCRDTEEIETARSPANCHTKPRKMDQKSLFVIYRRVCHPKFS